VPGVEWRIRWHITVRWDRAENSPAGTVVVERVVDSPADLRRLIERARADPHVVAFPYHPVRQLVGDEPTECGNGHGYGGGSATRAVRDWWPCCCGGHLVIRCRDSAGTCESSRQLALAATSDPSLARHPGRRRVLRQPAPLDRELRMHHVVAQHVLRAAPSLARPRRREARAVSLP
jgi:hypothetical protein